MKRLLILVPIAALFALVLWAAMHDEPRIHLRPEESPTRAINWVAAKLNEQDAAAFREAATRLMVHAALQDDDKMRSVAVLLEGKSVSEVMKAYRDLSKSERKAANNVLQFDRQ